MYNAVRRPSLAIVVVVVLIALGISSHPINAESRPTAIQFGSVSPSVIPAVSDYASDVRNLGWNFSDDENYSTLLTRPNFVNGGSIVGGWFQGTTANTDPKIWPQDLNIPDKTVPTQNEGAINPINTSLYRYLTYRLCSTRNDSTIVYWHKNGDFKVGNFGHTTFKPVTAGCGVYSFDLRTDRFPNPGANDIPWTSSVMQSISIKPGTVAGTPVKIDWARLSSTAPSSNPVVTINWTPVNETFSLFFDTTPSPSSSTLTRVDGAQNISGRTGQFRWTTPNLAPGTYYVFARNTSGQTTVSRSFVVNSPAVPIITSPSLTSGPDYATTALSNPWDMSSSADVAKTVNISSISFRDGIFTGTNTSGDPQIFLKVAAGTPIDPAKYYYLTYRMRILGNMDIGKGSVGRIFWTDTKSSSTKDIIDYEGWRMVSIDLRSVGLTPGSTSWRSGGLKTEFRLDPHEFPTARMFQIDDVKLTGSSQAAASFPIRYTVNDANSDPVTTTFQAVTTQGTPLPIRCAETAAAPKPGPISIFLPLIMNNVSSGGGGSGSTCTWNVGGIPNGTYFIKATTNDGHNTVSKTSETPMIVKH